MLNSLAIGLALYLVGYIALVALAINGVVVSDDVESNLSYIVNATLPHSPDYRYWKLAPYPLYDVGCTIAKVLMYELIIAQSPDKMKGFVLGVMLGK